MTSVVEDHDLIRKFDLDIKDLNGNIWECYYNSFPEEYFWIMGIKTAELSYCMLATCNNVYFKSPYGFYNTLGFFDRIKPVIDAAKKVHEVLKAEG